MSSYREDTQETAVAHSETWGGLSVLTNEIVRAVDVLSVGVLVLLSSAAIATDEIPSSSQTWVTESAVVSDAAPGILRAVSLTQNSAKAGDALISKLLVLHEDSASTASTIPSGVLVVATDIVHASDTVIGTRYTKSLFIESARASDKSFRLASVMAQEAGVAHDSVIQRARIRELVLDTATASDIALDSRAAQILVVETARASDAVLATVLYAKSLITETALADDYIVGVSQGLAWTANTESWAMSRYMPYTINDVAVINGALYGVTDDGVYALQGGADVINGALVFGALDLGGNNGLVHPLGAYLEYEKTNGSAEMDVTTTQSGVAETFTYALANETADRLTNGRFVFGRGLRGRHFQFSLRINAEQATINDLLISSSPTKRRV